MPDFIKERALPRKIALCPHSNSISGIVSELCRLPVFPAFRNLIPVRIELSWPTLRRGPRLLPCPGLEPVGVELASR